MLVNEEEILENGELFAEWNNATSSSGSASFTEELRASYLKNSYVSAFMEHLKTFKSQL